MRIEPQSTSRVIIATSKAIFRAHIDPEVLVKWRAPAGMEARLADFSARRGGGYRMETRTLANSRRQSAAGSDIIRVRFVELVPDDLIVEAVTFESEDRGETDVMTITTQISPVTGGTKISVTAENVPALIADAEHRKTMEAHLKNLALLLE